MQCPECGDWMDYRHFVQEVIRYNGSRTTLSVEGWVCRRCGRTSLGAEEQRRIREATYAVESGCCR